MTRIAIIAVCLLSLVSEAFADAQCWLWVDRGGGTHQSPEDAAKTSCELENAQNKPYCDGGTATGDPDYSYQVGSTTCSVTGDPATGQSAQCQIPITTKHCLANGNCYPDIQTPYYTGVSQIPGPCPPPNPCTGKQGQQYTGTFDAASNGQACSPVGKDADGCTLQMSVAVKAGGKCVQSGTYTGSQDNSQTTPAPGSGSCVTGSAGTVCSEVPAGKNCGTFNGDEVCVDTIPPGSCVSYASGGVACAASKDPKTGGPTFTTPPTPDSGQAGVPATPAGAVSHTTTNGGITTTNIANYYNSSTVAGSSNGTSSTPGGKNVGNGGTGGGGSGSGAGGSGPSAANGDCGATGVDCGSDGTVPSLPQAKTMQETLQDYYSSLAGTPIAQAVGGLAGSLPTGGECPTTSFAVFGQTFELNVQCQIWAQYVQPVLTVVMLAFWTLIGFRILFSA